MMFGWIILIIVAFYFWGNRSYCTTPNHYGHDANALDILKERYARSEISSEEFHERKQVLEKTQ